MFVSLRESCSKRRVRKSRAIQGTNWTSLLGPEDCRHGRRRHLQYCTARRRLTNTQDENSHNASTVDRTSALALKPLLRSSHHAWSSLPAAIKSNLPTSSPSLLVQTSVHLTNEKERTQLNQLHVSRMQVDTVVRVNPCMPRTNATNK